ncbi:HNH endonuclease [Xanthobacter flavus]|uniref:HNH endonuclease n=1 Tax=Xanthobacter flavus TaxID=281 RepID=UPI0037271B1F
MAKNHPTIRAHRSRLKPARQTIGTSTPKSRAPVYGTPEHREWSAAVIKRAGGRCQAPGCTRALPEYRMYADHIREVRDDGAPLDLANGQCLCAVHHGAKTADQRRKRLAASIA